MDNILTEDNQNCSDYEAWDNRLLIDVIIL